MKAHDTLYQSLNKNAYMRKIKLTDIRDSIWKTNPFAIAWKKKNDIIAIQRMWVEILKTNNK